MSTKIYAVDWSHTEEKLAVWDGKKITSKMPKAEPGIMIVTENMPNKMAKEFLEAKITIMRCSPNASADYRKKYNFDKTDQNDAIIIYDLYRDSPAKFRPMKAETRLKQMYVNYQQLTKQITGVKNRQWHAEDEANQKLVDGLETVKEQLLKDIRKELKNYKIYTEFLEKIKGIGPALAAGLIAEVGDISRFENVSDLNAYFGVHVQNGKCVRREKGKVANWNSNGRTLVCELIPDQFIKGRSPVYRGIYDDEKAKCMKMVEEDAEKSKDERRVQSKLHAERRARRKAGKIFLSHFWKAWREIEGLPTPQPYALGIGGHSHEILPPTAYPGLAEGPEEEVVSKSVKVRKTTTRAAAKGGSKSKM